MRNELGLIDDLTSCVINSSWQPDLWIIVDDASTDGSGEKLDKLQQRHSFIRIHHLDERREYMGFHISEVLRQGLKAAGEKLSEADYIGFLDADIRFGSSYWQRLKDFLDSDPRAGIVSGVLCSRNAKGLWQIEPFQRIDNPRGGLRLVKKECFEDIGGVPRSRAWDPVMNVKARVRGWGVYVLTEVYAASVRATDERFDRKTGELSRGQRDWHLHHPFFQVLTRAFFKALKGNSSGAWYYVLGYLREWRRGGEQFPDPDVRSYYRRERSREWLRMIRARILGGENPHSLIPQKIVPEEKIFY